MGFDVADEGAVCLYNDFLGIAVVDYGALLAPGVELVEDWKSVLLGSNSARAFDGRTSI